MKRLLYLPIILLISCATRQDYITQEQVKNDTISGTIESLTDLKADRTEEVKGYWKKQGRDSVYVKSYKRKPKNN